MNSKTNSTADIEAGGGLQALPQQTPSLGGHGGHNHNHSHSNEKPCCNNHAPKQQPVQVVYNPPSPEELNKATPEQIRLSLSTMIRFGGFEDAFVPMMELVQKHRPEGYEEILTTMGSEDHYSLLHWAAKRVDDVRFLRYVLDTNYTSLISSPSSDKVAMHPLHWCATAGSIKNAAVLLEHGARLEATDGAGCTPLILAAQYGHVNLVAYLLQKGANGRALDHCKDSALHWAAYKGSIQVCGHLLFRQELDWTSIDSYGQTPLHLASLRGHVPVVRYLLEEGSREEGRRVLHLPDAKGKTCYDLAIQKNRPAVAACLLEFQELYATRSQKSCYKSLTRQAKEFCSWNSWKLWFGCAVDAHSMDVAPKFPLYFTLFHMFLYTLFFPFVFCPVLNTSEGILWDYTGFLVFQMLCCAVMWYSAYKVYYTDPGCLDESHPETSHYRKLYEETIENLGAELEDEARKKEQLHRQRQLCHTCHIVRPIRSKHCRSARRCVLMFDHYCPFVGTSIGLYNYPWFYLDLLSMSICCITFMVTLYIYLSRQFSYTLLFSGIYLSLFILMAGGMCLYHTQLTMFNLTTNEHMNLGKYEYLTSGTGRRMKGMTFGPGGSFHNPFFQGWWANMISRLYHPNKATYTLPDNKTTNNDDENKQSLLSGPNIV